MCYLDLSVGADPGGLGEAATPAVLREGGKHQSMIPAGQMCKKGDLSLSETTATHSLTMVSFPLALKKNLLN